MAKFKLVNRNCKYVKCGKEFLAKRRWHEYCDPKCRVADWREGHPVMTPDVLEDIEKIKKHIGLT